MSNLPFVIFLLLPCVVAISLDTTPGSYVSGDSARETFYESVSPGDLVAMISFETFTGGSTAKNLVDDALYGGCSAGDCTSEHPAPESRGDGICGFSAAFDKAERHAIKVDIDMQANTLPQLSWGGWFKLTEQPGTPEALWSTDNGNFDRGVHIDARSSGCSFAGSHFGAFVGTGAFGLDPTAPCIRPQVGEWYFIAVTYDATPSATFYLGTQTSDLLSATSATSYDGALSFVTLGANPTFGESISMHLDEWFAYSTDLSSSQIEDIFEFTRTDRCKILTPTTTTGTTGSGSDFIISDPPNNLFAVTQGGDLLACPDGSGNLRSLCDMVFPEEI